MPYLVRAFPVIRPLEELNAFLSELAKHADTDKFYRKYGVSHESAHLQRTARGELLLIVVTVLEDLQEAAPRYQAAPAEFDRWFKEQIRLLSGIDPNVNPLGPPTSEVFSWEASSGEARFMSAAGAA